MALQNADKIKELTEDRSWGDPADDPPEYGREIAVNMDDGGNLVEPEAEPEPVQDADEPTAPLDFIPEAPKDDDGEPVAEPEPEADPAIAALKAESKGRLNALISERQRNSQIMDQLAELREVQHQQVMAQQPEPEPIDPDVDQVGYLESVVDQRTSAVHQEVAAMRQSLEEDRLKRDVVQVGQASAYHENEFAKDHADYPQAFDFVKDAYVNQFKAEGLTDAQANGKATMLAYQTSKQAMMGGQSPAQVVWNEAQRLGFQPAPATPVNTVTPQAEAGAQRPSLSKPGMEGTGNTPQARKGEVTREWIFNNLDKTQRMALWRNPQINRELDETGKTTLPVDFEV